MDTYDRESGQVFKETIMKSKHCIPWDQRCPANQSNGWIDLPPKDGVKTLQSLAMEKLIQQARNLAPETLEGVPQTIAIRIWTAIRREWRESFHVWANFVEAGFWERTFKHAVTIADWTRWPLLDTFGKLSSPSGAWVVDLTLADVNTSAADLKEVSRIAGLRSLHLLYSRESHSRNFDDRIVRAWSDRVENEGAFTWLETLSVVNAPAITSDVFEHFSNFPALGTFVHGTSVPYRKRDLKKVERLGWTNFAAEEATGHGEPSVESLKRTYHHSGKCWEPWRASFVQDVAESQRLRQTKSAAIMPRLDARLGLVRNINKGHILHTYVFCFEGNPDFVVRKPMPEADHGGRSRKRHKTQQSKAADFAAMLG